MKVHGECKHKVLGRVLRESNRQLKRNGSTTESRVPQKRVSLLILQPFRHFTYVKLILQPFRCFTYVTVHSPTLLSLYLRHSSFSNPSTASDTSHSFSNPSFASPTSLALHLRYLASRPCRV